MKLAKQEFGNTVKIPRLDAEMRVDESLVFIFSVL